MAKQVWGPALYHNYGPEAFLSDELLDQIILCTGAGKLLSAGDVAKETCWVDAVEFGSSILNIMQKVYHPPAPALAPAPVPAAPALLKGHLKLQHEIDGVVENDSDVI